MKELILNIEQWAEDRNIIKGANPAYKEALEKLGKV